MLTQQGGGGLAPHQILWLFSTGCLHVYTSWHPRVQTKGKPNQCSNLQIRNLSVSCFHVTKWFRILLIEAIKIILTTNSTKSKTSGIPPRTWIISVIMHYKNAHSTRHGKRRIYTQPIFVQNKFTQQKWKKCRIYCQNFKKPYKKCITKMWKLPKYGINAPPKSAESRQYTFYELLCKFMFFYVLFFS